MQLNVQQVKDSILQEYRENAVTYSTASVKVEELQHYVSCRNYNLQSVDAMFDILCNASNVTAFVIGQKYDYSDPQNVICISGWTEIRRISTTENTIRSCVLLLKSGEHYDCLLQVSMSSDPATYNERSTGYTDERKERK